MKRLRLILLGIIALFILATPLYASQKRTDFEIHMQAGGVGVVTCGDFDDPPMVTDIGGGFIELVCPITK